ncbi:MAG TPA: S8 family serine peptidase [Candidatus Limnocylindrales bacterium]|nr:S8 family serine peptidase [Candidatus Limnocylindrales bacterium]
MRRFNVALAVALALVMAGLGPASAASPRSLDGVSDRSRTTGSSAEYAVVWFKDQALARYDGHIPGYARTKPQPGQRLALGSSAARSYARYLAEKHAAYRGYLRTAAPRAQVVRDLRIVANAVAVKRNGHGMAALARHPDVLRVTPSWTYRPSMNISNGLIDSAGLWADLGGQSNAGTGIKVAVIDTGIDLGNHFLSDAGYPTASKTNACPGTGNVSNKVIVCRVYASGNTGAASPHQLKVFDHGTHVAGTIAGAAGTTGTVEGTSVSISGLSGVAPKALLGDYNVFPGFGAGFVAFGGSAFSHDIAQALEDALRDGMDVANMSLGGGVQGPHDFLAEAVDGAVDAGMVVAVAAGNSGPGQMTVESPGSAFGALTAGASTNPHFVGIPVTVGGTTYGAALGDFANFDPAVTAAYTVTTPTNGCTAISTNLTGKIALIDRGVCAFSTKIRNAQNAGAIGVLVVNIFAGDPSAMGGDGTPNQPTIPAAMLGKADGNAIKPSGTATVDGTAPAEFLTGNEDIIAGFSSRGPTPYTYLIKPDVTAPGVNVLSSVFNDKFAFFQGTSMATPHVAGAAALLRQLHPTWDPWQIKSALVNTAKRPVWDHVNGTAATGVNVRGGGRIDLGAASETPATIVPASASFGYYNGNTTVGGQVKLWVTNVSGSSKTFAFAVSGNAPSGVVTASPSSLTLANGAGGWVTLTLNGGKASSLASGDYSGDVTITSSGPTLKVPWFVRVNREGKP